MTIRASRSQLIWSPVLGWALLSCASTAVQAQVETPSPARQTLEQQTPLVDLVPLALPEASSGGGGGPGGNELGISLGAFTLHPTLAIDAGYDNNVYAEPQTGSTTASAITVIKPTIDLRSEWLNHSLRLTLGGVWGFYANAPSQNFENYNIEVNGTLDIAYDFALTGLIAFRRSTEALGTPNVAFAQAPTVVHSVPIRLALSQKFNRLSYQLSASATRYWFYDYSTITDLGLPGTSRNRTDYEQTLQIGYEVSPGIRLFVAPSLNQVVYADTINAAGQQRDASGWTFSVGASVETSAKTTLEATLGTTTLTYLATGASNSAFVFGLTGSWNPYEPLILRPAISRSIQQSALSSYQNYISTTYGVDFTYDVHGPWKAIGGVAYNTADFNPASGVSGVPPRTDYFLKGSIGMLYEFRPQLSIGPVYEYTQGWSSDVATGGPAYNRSLFSIRLVAKR